MQHQTGAELAAVQPVLSEQEDEKEELDGEYIASIRSCLERALCIQRFPSQRTERQACMS